MPAPGNFSERGFSGGVCGCRCSLLTMLGGGEALLNSVGVLHGRHPCRTPAGADISCGTFLNLDVVPLQGRDEPLIALRTLRDL